MTIILRTLLIALLLLFPYSIGASSCGFISDSSSNENISNIFKVCVINKKITGLTNEDIIKCSGEGFEPGSATMFLGKDLLVTALHLFVQRNELKLGLNLKNFITEVNQKFNVFIMDSHNSPIVAEAKVVDAFEVKDWLDGVVALELKEGSNITAAPFPTWSSLDGINRSLSVSWKGFHIDDNLIMEAQGHNVLNNEKIKIEGGFTASFDRFQGLSGGAIVDTKNNNIVYGIGLGGFDSETLEATTYLKADILVNKKYTKLVKMSHILNKFSLSQNSPVYKNTSVIVNKIVKKPDETLTRLTLTYDPAYAYLALMRCEEFIDVSSQASLLTAIFSIREKTCSMTPAIKCFQKASLSNISHDKALVSYVNTQREKASEILNNVNSDSDGIRLAIDTLNNLQIHTNYLKKKKLIGDEFENSSIYDIALAYTKLKEYDNAIIAANQITNVDYSTAISFNKNQLMGNLKNRTNAPSEALKYFSKNIIEYLENNDNLSPQFYSAVQDLSYTANKSGNVPIERISIESDEILSYDFEMTHIMAAKNNNKIPVSLEVNGDVLKITPSVWQQAVSDYQKAPKDFQLIINEVNLSELKQGTRKPIYTR